MEQPGVFDELGEIGVGLFTFEGFVKDSVDDGSGGVVESGVFLDGDVLSGMVSGSVSHVGFVFGSVVGFGEFPGFLGFLDELHQVIFFVGGSSHSHHSNLFYLFLSRLDQTID